MIFCGSKQEPAREIATTRRAYVLCATKGKAFTLPLNKMRMEATRIHYPVATDAVISL